MGVNGWVPEVFHSLEANFAAETEDTLSLIVAYNGLGLFVPVIAHHWAEALKVQHLFITGLDATTNIDICQMFPNSAIKDRLLKLVPILKAGIKYVTSIKFVDGSAQHVHMDEAIDFNAVQPSSSQATVSSQGSQPGTSTSTPSKRKRVVDPEAATSVEGSETRAESEKRCKRPDKQCFCGKGFSSVENMNKHQANSHKDSKWNCSSCKKLYTAQGALWKHYRTVHLGQYIYMCHICKVYGSDEKANVLRHFIGEHPDSVEAVEAKDLVPTCKKCKEPFSSVSALKKHEAICGKKVSDKPFVCEVADCLEGFRNSANLRRHCEIAHPEPGDISDLLFKCPLCSNTYMYKWSLDTHLIELHKKAASKQIKTVNFPEYRRR